MWLFIRISVWAEPSIVVASQVLRRLLKSVVKYKHFGYAYLVHYYTVLSHNQGVYYSSLILQALELPPGRVEQKFNWAFVLGLLVVFRRS